MKNLNHQEAYQVAMAAAIDAGNRNMRANNRTKWSLEDQSAYVCEFNRLLPDDAEIAMLKRQWESSNVGKGEKCTAKP